MLTPFSSTPKKVNSYVSITDNSYPQYTSWSISQNFSENEIVGFDFRPHSDWSDGSPDLIYSNVSGTMAPVRYLHITVTNPQGNFTTIRIMLIIDSIGGGASAVSIFPDFYEVYNSTLSDYTLLIPARGYDDPVGGIVMDKGYPNTVQLPTNVSAWGGGTIYQLGRTTMEGTYNVTLLLDPETAYEPGEVPPLKKVSPPVDLVICEIRVETNYPYSWLLPAGISVGIIGVAVTVPGVISKKQKPVHRA